MYLKSLEVHGFKSFANKLVFEFHNGITAIVGPNGSGKSNVADAVRWVLGEQSAKQLRGAKMEDVIFAGTQMRKPLGYAYVAITINNEDHKLNVPYEEVKIARRVYRSGESEYLLNGASCRLKDVQEILLDTGIGKEGYSIIGQGQIDKILSGKPEDRRELFDEAAGIVKFKKRKAAALKNLLEEQQNLTRIEDILSELDKQVGPLEQQSVKAKEYLALRDELKNLDINLFLFEYDQTSLDVKELESKKNIAVQDLDDANKELDKTKEEYLGVERELENENRNLDKQRELLSVDKLSLNQAENDIKVYREQINALIQNKEHNAEKMNSLVERIENCQKELDEFNRQKEEEDSKKNELLLEKKKCQDELDAINNKIIEIESEIEKNNRALIEYMNQNADVMSDKERMKTLLEQNNIKKAEITKRVLENKTEAVRLSEILEREKKEYDQITEKISGLDSVIYELKNTMADIARKESDLLNEHRDIQKRYHIENSKLESIKNLTERYEGYGVSIKRIMEQKKNAPGIIGVVADIIRVKKDYELAVETALGGSIQNIVTDNENTAKEMISYLKKNRFGRATFLPLTNMKAKPVNLSGGIMSEPGVIGLASKLVEADAKFSNLVEYLLGRFVVVDNIENGIALAKKYHHTMRIVTTEGDLLNPGGSMSGGAYKNNNNLLGRRRQMEDLLKVTNELKQRLVDLSEKLKENEKSKTETSDDLAKDTKIRQEMTIKQNTFKINYDRANNDLQKNKEKLNLIMYESKEASEAKEKLENEINEISRTMDTNEQQKEELDKSIISFTEELDRQKEYKETVSDKNNQILMDIATAEQSIQNVLENLIRSENSLKELKSELDSITKSGDDVYRDVEKKEAEIASTEENITDIKRHIEELQKSIHNLSQKKEELTLRNKEFFDKREELSTRKVNLDKECFRLDSQIEKMKERITSYTNYMWEQYELTYNVALEAKVEIELSANQMKQQISKIKNDMKALGDVNINAIEQYKEVQERYEHLHLQHDDLIEAANVLTGIIDELDMEMRKQFEQQFGEIKTRFDNVFKELFGGGRGTLELTEDDDILEAGIKIVAQPPGKKLQNMMQLSGGEKALTAIALLFAIQSLKPSPFCLLDEIEAALDDSNVSRYAEYLHKLTKDTQFIVITHRRGTMNAADILYGITMQEKGISTLVSVNLLDEKEIAN